MPYFSDLLSADELAAVVKQVKSFSAAFSRPNKQIKIPIAIPSSLESVARGKALFVSEGCTTCHGEEGRGGQAFDDGSGHQVFARDLTAPWAFRGGSRAEIIWLRLTTGIMPGPMPSYADVLSADARWDLANFVVSLARKPPWEKGDNFGGVGFTSNLVQRGDYVARWEVCGLCHTQIDPTGIYNVDGAFLAGGMRVGYYPHGYSVLPRRVSAGGACRRLSTRYAMAKRRIGRSIRLRCFGPFFTISRTRTQQPSLHS